VLRRIDGVPWWSKALAHLLFRRERRALALAATLDVAPRLLFAERRMLVRRWIAGVPLHIAKPQGDIGYFRSAKAALRRLHRAGVTHNDLAKEQNWLYADGRAYLTDFQLASCFPHRRGGLFRIARYEDLRHLLKHKRRYAPGALTPAERRVLAPQEFADPDLDGDRQEGLLRDHARAQCYRPRRPRHALRERSAGDRRAATHPSGRA
jgi:hypothetical protein